VAQEAHLLAVGYRHVRGGEDAFLKAGQDIRTEGGKADKAVSALDRVVQNLHARLKETPGFAGAVARALREVSNQRGPNRFREDVEQTNRSLQQGMANLRAYNQRLREIAAAEARGSGDAVRRKFDVDDRVAAATSAMGVGRNTRAGREIRRQIEEEEELKQKIQEVARAREEAAEAEEKHQRGRDTARTNLAALEQEVEDTRRLVAAKKLGEEAYRREVAAIASRNAAMRLGSAATQEEIARARQLATELTDLAAKSNKVAGVLDLLPGRAGAFAAVLGNLRERLAGVSATTVLVAGSIAALVAGFIGLSAGVSRALDALGPFEQSMRNVQAASGATEEELRKLSDAALDISQNTRFDPRQAAEGLYALSSAGFSANEQLQALPQTLSFAEAAQADLGQATETVVGALKVFNLTAADSQRVADVFTASVAVSSLNADRLQVAMRNAGPAAAAMNQSFEGTVAALAILTNKLNSGELAGTGLKTALLQVSEKSKELGITVTDTAGRLLPLPDVIERMEKAGISGAQAIHVLGSEAGPAMAALLAEGSAALRQMEVDLQANGQAAATAGKQIDTYEGSQAKLANSVKVFWIRLGQAIVGGQRDVLGELTGMVQNATAYVVAHADDIRAAFQRMADLVIGAFRILEGAVKATLVVLENLRTILIAVGIAWAGWKLGALAQGLTVTAAGVSSLTKALALQEAVLALVSRGWKALTAAMAANPVGAIAVALGLVYLGLQKLIDRQVEAYDAFIQQNGVANQNHRTLLDLAGGLEVAKDGTFQLRKETERLTQAQIDNARATIQQRALERDDLVKKAAEKFREASAVSEEAKRRGYGRRSDTTRFNEAYQEGQNLENQSKQLTFEIDRATAALDLHEKALKKDGNAAGDTARSHGQLDTKVKDSIKSLTRAAVEAERIAAARKKGVLAAEAERLTIERENAALDAGVTLGSQLGNVIEGLVDRRQRAERATSELNAADELAITNSRALLQAEAELADTRSGNTIATQRLAAQFEAEDEIKQRLLKTDSAEAEAIRTSISLRTERLRAIQAEQREVERELDFKRQVADLEARLADAKSGTTKATFEYNTQLEIENRLREDGIKKYSAEAIAVENQIRQRRELIRSKEAEIRAEEQLREFQRNLGQQQAQLADEKQAIELTRQYGEEIGRILVQYGYASEATKQFAIDQEFLQEVQRRGISEIEGYISGLYNQIKAQHETIDSLDKYRAGMALLAHVNEPINDAWRQTKDTILDVIGDVLTGAEVNWKSLLKSMLDMWIRAIVQMVARWVAAQRVMQAEAVTTQAISAGGGGGGKGGGTGYAGYAAMAYKGYSWFMGTSWGQSIMGNPMTGGNSFMGGSGSGAMGAAIFAVVAAIIINQIKTSGRSHARTQIDFGGSQGIGIGLPPGGAWNGNGGGHNTMQTLRGAQEVIKQVTLFIQSLGGDIDRLSTATSSLTIGKVGQGKKSRWYVTYAEGLVKEFGKDYEAALEFALVQAIRQTPTKGLSPEVAAAIKNSTAEKLDQLQKDIDTAMAAVRARLGQTGSQVYDTVRKYQELIEANQKLGVSTDALVEARNRELGAIRDQMLGVNTSTADFLANLVSFNAGIDESTRLIREQTEEQLRNAQARLEEMLASGPTSREDRNGRVITQTQEQWEQAIARLRESIAKYTAELDKIPQRLSDEELSMAIFDSLYRYLEGSSKYAEQAHKYARMKVELEFEAIRLQLVAMGKWEEFAQMWQDAYNAALAAAGGKGKGGRGGGGSTRKEDQDNLRDMLKDHAWEQSLRGLSAYQRGVAEINRKWDEAIPLAHGNKDLLAQIAKARQEEIAALREQAREEHRAELKPFLEDYGKSPFQLQLEDLRKKFEEARTRARELGEAVWKVNIAEQRATKALGEQAIASLNLPTTQVVAQMEALADTMKFLQDNAEALGLSEKDLADIRAQVGQQQYLSLVDGLNQYVQDETTRRELAQMRYDLEIANYRLQFEYLKSMGVLTDEQIRRVEDLFGKLPKVAPDAGPGGRDDGPRYRGYDNDNTFQQQQDELQRRRDDLVAKIQAWEDLRLSAPEKELRDLNKQFEEMRNEAVRLRMDVGRVEAAYRIALEDFFKRLKQGIQDLRDSLDFEEYSPLNAQQRLDAAQQNFNDLAARAAAGDLSAYEQIPEAAQRLLDEARAFYNSGVGFQEIFQQVRNVLDALLAAPATVNTAAAPVVAANQAAAPVQSAYSNVIPFPVASVAAPAQSPAPAQAAAPVVVVNGGNSSDSATAAEVRELKTKLLELERENIRTNLENRQLYEQMVEAQKKSAEEMAKLNGYLERLLGRLAGAVLEKAS
jgi:TP901 family phage tail tape measure protein